MEASEDADAAGEYQEGDVPAQLVWDAGAAAWKSTKRVALCCSCADMTLALNDAATSVLGIPAFTLSIAKGCDSDAPASYTTLAECGGDGWVQLVGFSKQACEAEPRDEPECVNLFRMRLKCSDCALPDGSCANCKDGKAAGVYRVTVSGMTGTNAAYNGDWYLVQDADDPCACVYTAECGTITFAMTIGPTKVTLTFGGAPGGGSGSYESGEVEPKTRNCLAPIEVSQVSGVGPGALTLTPVDCGGARNEPDVPPLCVEGGPDLYYKLEPDGCAVKTGTMAFSDAGYSDSFAMGACVCPGNATQSHVPGEDWTLTVGCSGVPDSPIAGVNLNAPTGSATVSLTVVSAVPLLLHVTGIITCPDRPDPDGSKDTPYTLCISEVQSMCEGGPYWCVVQADGSRACTQSEEEPPTPEGVAVEGPYADQETCQRVCECVQPPGAEAMAVAAMTAAPAPKVSTSRAARRSLPLRPTTCPYGGGSRADDMEQPCTSCGAAARHVYACDHPANPTGTCTRGNPRSGLWTCADCPHHPAAAG